MFEIIRQLEKATEDFSPTVAVAIGLVAVAAGLFVWLGGLGLRKLLVAIVGAVAGGLCAYFITGRSLPPTLVSAAVGAAVAVTFEQILITAVAALLAALCTFAAFAYLFSPDFSEGLGKACLQMPAYCWPIMAAVVVVIVAAGAYLWPLTSAMCCAALGTILIFAGMIVLLLQKGAKPVYYMDGRRLFFGAIFAAMVAFGTLEQMLFCKLPAAKPTARARKRKGPRGDESDEEAGCWRNR
jgi:hypothetical protein